MKAERWQQVNDLFQSATELPPKERAAFIDEACRGDEALCREVGSLIASYERAANFIESPAYEVAPELLTNDAGALVRESIGHYRIDSLIGVGGMGEVYLARDELLGRKVALKFLPKHLTAEATQLTRFKTEARTASALNHPNILTVYEVGAVGNRHFIATEFIEGITLRASLAGGKMNLLDAFNIAVQVASALAAAHETGVVHRDIKPENIMLRPDGYVKVLDFGIAKLTEQPPAAGEYRGVLGTARYMSPEQARGQIVDARTDIWSLGAVLYEMTGGVAPFASETPSDCIASILKTEPPPLSALVQNVPVKLLSIVQKALRKDREERYQTINEMLSDLRSLKGELEPQASSRPIFGEIKRHKEAVLVTLIAALFAAGALAYRFYLVPPAPPLTEKSVAVLPFADLSSTHDQAYICDGIQEEILTRLSKIADLKVISRTSTQRFKSKPENLPEIAKQLGVANVVEGSVQKNGDTVRVHVQLIKTANDSHLWADTFDRKLTDIFSVESEVAKAIADQLRAQMTGREERVIAAKPTDNPEAYDAYLRGLSYTLKSGNTPANALGAQKYLRQAVRLDPKFALGWALLSTTDARGYLTVNLQPTAALHEEARKAAETALTLEPELGEAVLAKGYYHYACLKDYDTAERYFERARQLLPNSSRIPASLAYVARRRGEWERTESYFNEAERLDPLNAGLLGQHAASYIILRRFPDAVRKLDQVLSLTPDDLDALATKAAIAQAEGDLPRAAAILAPLHPPGNAVFALETQTYQAILERRPAQIISRLRELLSKPDPALGYLNGELRFWLGWAQKVAGDQAAAQESWRQAHHELELLLQGQPENYLLIGDLALTSMGLGDKAAAFALAERAMALNPIEKDAVNGPISLEILARVATQAAEPDRAIAALQKLLSMPYDGALAAGIPLTSAILRLDPMFDVLRGDPRFEKLVK